MSAKSRTHGKADKKYTCVDLFAGAGGFSLAAIEANLTVVAAVEFDRAAAQTYRANLPRVQDPAPLVFEQDILSLKPYELSGKADEKSFECDVVLGGPPCQGFSVHRINSAGVGDGRNKLILRYFHFVSKLRPKVFLMENVPGITWARHKDYLDAFYTQGKKAGYTLFAPALLDAQDFGIPQRRKRAFILGVRNDLMSAEIDWPPKPTHGNEKARLADESLSPWNIAEEIFKRPLKANDENAIHMNHRETLLRVFESTPPNGGSRHQSNRVLACHANHNGHKDVYGRIDPSKPGPTMTTACINPSKGRFLHPVEHHGITVRHAARFQTFPDWYVFKGGMMAAAKQVGNAVPVEFGKILIKVLVEILDKNVKMKKNQQK